MAPNTCAQSTRTDKSMRTLQVLLDKSQLVLNACITISMMEFAYRQFISLSWHYQLTASFILSCLHLRYTLVQGEGRWRSRKTSLLTYWESFYGRQERGSGNERMDAFRPGKTWVSFRARALCKGGLTEIWRNFQNTCMHSHTDIL